MYVSASATLLGAAHLVAWPQRGVDGWPVAAVAEGSYPPAASTFACTCFHVRGQARVRACMRACLHARSRAQPPTSWPSGDTTPMPVMTTRRWPWGDACLPHMRVSRKSHGQQGSRQSTSTGAAAAGCCFRFAGSCTGCAAREQRASRPQLLRSCLRSPTAGAVRPPRMH